MHLQMFLSEQSNFDAISVPHQSMVPLSSYALQYGVIGELCASVFIFQSKIGYVSNIMI